MPDIYTKVTEAPAQILAGLMTALELRARLIRLDPREHVLVLTLHHLIADGRSLPFAGSTFDAVVFHTTLCHVPGTEVTLQEGVRVLRPGGCLAAFEGDYAIGTLATRAGDPLDAYAESFREHFVHDPEARRGVDSGEYFGHIAYMSLVARKPV